MGWAEPWKVDVSSRFGAPMGRRSFNYYPDDVKLRVQLARVRMVDGGYDQGGAYWGAGVSLFCAWDDSGQVEIYVRAASREEAKQHFFANWIAGIIARGIVTGRWSLFG